MEITREMIEQVIDAAGADYNTAKKALEDHDGKVDEAIEAIKAAVVAEEADKDQAIAEEADKTEAGTGESGQPSDQIDGEEAAGAAEEKADEEAAGTAEEKADEETAEQTAEQSDDKKEDAFEEFFSDADEYANRMADTLKKRVMEGNVKRIVISRNGRKLLDIPVMLGVIGGFVGLMAIPWTMIIGALVAYGMNCRVEIVSDTGKNEEITIINEKK